MAVKPKSPQITKAQLQKWVNLVNRLDGNVSRAAEEAGISARQLKRHLDTCKKRGVVPPKPFNPQNAIRSTDIADDELHDVWNVYERYGYDAQATAEALGIHESSLRNRIKKAQHKFGYVKKSLGVTHAQAAAPLPLPDAGKINYFMLTTAQNNTKVHDATWASGINLAKHYDAEIKVSTFTYIGNEEGSQKRGHEKSGEAMGRKVEDRWYDPRVVPYISDEFQQLAPGLVWCGHSNTLPTASDPLRGTQSLNGRASGVWPHTRIEMRPVATAAGEATKFNFTTGAVTLRNYIQKRAGIAAEFYHCFGFLLVAVDSNGNWWCRQLNADSEGNIYDLDLLATPEGVFEWIDEKKGGLEGLVYGDIHRSKIDETIRDATWGPGGLVDFLKPKVQVFHDLLNFNPSHHSRKDPHEMYKQRKRAEDLVYGEIEGDGSFLDWTHRPWSREVVVDSNHHRHLDRFLKEVDWRDDLNNARVILDMNLAWLDAIDKGEEEDFLAYEWQIRKMGYGKHAHFMNLTSEKPEKLSLVLCKGNGGGIEVGAHHGDRGPNGARGTPQNLSKMGRKNVIGDKHSPGIWGGTYVAGMTGKPRQGYNIGPGSWAAAHVPIYPNGKRQVLLFWKGMPHEPRG